MTPAQRATQNERFRRCVGLCLKETDYSETSQVVVLLTDNAGKIPLIAKGSKRIKNNSLQPIEPLFLYVVQYVDKSPLHLNVLTQATVKESFAPVVRSIETFKAACELLANVNAFVQNGQHIPGMFEMVHEALRVLSTAHPYDLPRARIGYTARLLALTGYYPNLEECFECKRPIVTKRFHFSFARGASICDQCLDSHPSTAIFDLKTSYLIGYSKRNIIGNVHSFGDCAEQAFFLLNRHIEHVLETKRRGSGVSAAVMRAKATADS